MTNQIIEVPDISVVKTINDEKQLLSLKDCKIKKDLLQGFGSGSGVMCRDDLYILDRWDPIIRMTTATDTPSFSIEKTGNIKVNWGDGFEDNNLEHTYTDGIARHDIVIYGKNASIKKFYCHGNKLLALDVSLCLPLELLWCNNNQLVELDVTKNINLTTLDCFSNQLTKLDITKNVNLDFFVCDTNQLTELDVTCNSNLRVLSCTFNQLSILDLSKNLKLQTLFCHTNQLSALDVTFNVDLYAISCYRNAITELDLTSNIALGELECSNNLLSMLDVSHNVKLWNLYCWANPFTTNTSKLIAFANTLPDRTGEKAGTVNVCLSDTQPDIQAICESKNWKLSAI